MAFLNDTCATALNRTIGGIPLFYVPVEHAYRHSIATYVHIGATTVLIWDVVDNAKGDFMLMFSLKFGIPTFIYVVNRFSLLAYAIGRAVLLTTPIEECGSYQRGLNAMLIIFLSFTTLFYYIRVCVVHSMNRLIVTFFGLTWLATVGMLTTISQTFIVHTAGPFCLEHIRDHLLTPTVIVLLVNDILAYAAVTYKSYTLFLTSVTKRLRSRTFGTSFPVPTSMLLQDIHLYGLVIVLTKAFIILAITGLPQPTSVMFIICHLVLQNVLCCRVYRNIRLSTGQREAQNGTSIDFRTTARNGHYFQGRHDKSTSSDTISIHDGHSSNPISSTCRRSDLVIDDTHSVESSFQEPPLSDEKQSQDRICTVRRETSNA